MSLSSLLRNSAESPENASIEELIKAFSRIFVESKITKDDYECIRDNFVYFPKKAIPTNIVQMTELEARFKEPLFMSRILHLCAHIRYTRYNDHFSEQDRPLQDILWWLEDIKTETLFLKNRSLDTLFFRYKTHAILKQFAQISELSALDLSLLYLNITGRLQSGITYNYEVEDIHNKLIGQIPENTQNKFKQLIDNYVDIPTDSDGIAAVLIARQWMDLTDQNLNPSLQKVCMDASNLHLLSNPDSTESSEDYSDDTSPSDSEEESSSDAKADQEEQSSESIESADETSDDLESQFEDEESDDNETESDQSNIESSVSESQDETLEETIDDLVDSFSLPEEKIKESKPLFDENRIAEETRQRDELEKMKNKFKLAFPKEFLQYQSRTPTDSDYRLASQLTNMFRKAKWRAPTKTIVREKMPPGRLNSRDAVNMTAQIHQGLPVTVEPFRRTVHAKVESPPLLLGMACDVSGSMSDSTGPMAQLMWACARAVPKVGGEFSAVSFGRMVKGLVKPGQKINKVPILNAKANYEEAYGAITSLIGALGWMQPKKSGIKILLISSDSEWRQEQLFTSGQLLQTLVNDYGVHVFWIPFQGNINYREYKNHWYQQHIPMFQVGTIVSFDNVVNIPLELGKIISEQVRVE